ETGRNRTDRTDRTDSERLKVQWRILTLRLITENVLLPQTLRLLSMLKKHVYFLYNLPALSKFRLPQIEKSFVVLLKSLVSKHPIKFNLKLEATYNIPNVDNSSENRLRLQLDRFLPKSVREIVEEDFIKLMAEQDEYSSKGTTYRKLYNARIKYNFSGLTFPTNLHQVNIFETNNPNVTVNVYALEKHFQSPQKFPKYEVFPLKVVDEEKTDHFDLLLITDDDENSHFTYISNFSRLVRSQKTRYKARAVFCKRCFTSFEPLNINKYELNERIRFEEHKLTLSLLCPHICGQSNLKYKEMSGKTFIGFVIIYTCS
ncbi:Uncharacterized protein FWK35_00028364, partial [Aphis craccivora]